MSAELKEARHDAVRRFLKRRRQEAELSQAKLAACMGRPQSFISDTETGQHKVTVWLTSWNSRTRWALTKFAGQLDMCPRMKMVCQNSSGIGYLQMSERVFYCLNPTDNH
jgi:hypothetical protein